MPRSVPREIAPLLLVCGEDDFAVKERAKEVYAQWTGELGGLDHEIIDGSVSHSGEALRALAKLREGAQSAADESGADDARGQILQMLAGDAECGGVDFK